MSEEPDKTSNKVERDAHGRILPGQGSLNPEGRPKGSISIKDKVRQYLQDHPDEVEEIVRHFVTKNRELMWQMLEGRPQADLNIGGQEENPFKIIIEKNEGDKG